MRRDQTRKRRRFLRGGYAAGSFGWIEERRDDLEVRSPGSPLGRALLGHRVGDVVDYETPTGKVLKVEIVGLEG